MNLRTTGRAYTPDAAAKQCKSMRKANPGEKEFDKVELSYKAWDYIAYRTNMLSDRLVACVAEVIEVLGLPEKQERSAISATKHDIYEIVGGLCPDLWDCVSDEEKKKMGGSTNG